MYRHDAGTTATVTDVTHKPEEGCEVEVVGWGLGGARGVGGCRGGGGNGGERGNEWNVAREKSRQVTDYVWRCTCHATTCPEDEAV